MGKMAVPSDNYTLSCINQIMSKVSDVSKVIRLLDSHFICWGSEDKKYVILQASRQGVFMDKTSNTCLCAWS